LHLVLMLISEPWSSGIAPSSESFELAGHIDV
jgi:hypothetical protein